MRTFLPEILAASIAGSVMALVLLGIRRIFRKHISRTWCYYIWLLVLVRLLIPYSPIQGLTGQLAASVRQGASGWYEALQQRAEGIVPEGRAVSAEGDTVPDSRAASAEGDIGAANGEEANTMPANTMPADGETANTDPGNADGINIAGIDNAKTAASRAESLSDAATGFSGAEGRKGQNGNAYVPVLLFLLWLLPALGLLLYRILHFNRFLKGIKGSRRALEDPDILRIYGRLCEELGIRKAVPVYVCGKAASSGGGPYSPMLTGFFRPFLVLPESLPGKWREAGTQQASLRAEYVLRHELVHLKRGDLYYKWLVQAAVCMHWFNPFLLKCAGWISEDCELSCDEAVIRRLPLSGRIAYGDTLVAALTDLNMPPAWGPAVSLCENAQLMKERLYAIMKYQKQTLGGKITAMVLSAVLVLTGFVCGGFTSAAAAGGVTRAGETVPFAGEGTMSGSPWKGGLTSSSYFNNGYYIQLIWNYPSGSAYRIKEVTAGDRVFQVAFSELTEGLSSDAAFMEALRLCLLEQKQREADMGGTGFWREDNLMERPLVYYMEGPYTQTPDELAVKTYSVGADLALYATVISKASPEITGELTERAYEETDAARFSITCEYISEDSRGRLAERAYEDDQIGMFSILSEDLTEAQRAGLMERADRDDRTDYYYILKNNGEG